MKRMRRYLALLLAVAMMMSMVRYGGSFADATETSAEIETVESVKEAEENTEAEEKEKTTEAEEKEEKTTEAEEEEETTEAEEKEEKTTEAEEEEKTTEAEETEEKTTEAEVKEEKTTEAEEEEKTTEAEEKEEKTTEAEEEEEKTTEAEIEEKTFVYKDDEKTVTAVLSDKNSLPENAKLVVEEVELSEDQLAAAEKKVGDDSEIADYIAYDMHFEVDGVETEPENATVSVSIVYKKSQTLGTDTMNADASEVQLLHIDESEELDEVASVVKEADGEISSADFTTESFSVFVLTRLVDVDRTFVYEDDDVKITAVADEEEEILNSNLVQMQVKVIKDRDSAEYKKINKALQKEYQDKDNEVLLGFIYYDFTFLKGEDEVEPSQPVKVTIEHKKTELPENVSENLVDGTAIYHISEDESEKLSVEELDAEVKENSKSAVEKSTFKMNSFSGVAEASESSGSTMTRSDIVSGLGIADNFAVFAINFTNDNHMEGAVAVKNLTGNSSSMGNTDNVYQNATEFSLTISKTVSGTENKKGSFKFGIYTKNDNGEYERVTSISDIIVETDENGTGTKNVNADNFDLSKTYYVFELDQKGNPITGKKGTIDGIEYTVSYSSGGATSSSNSSSEIGGVVGNTSYIEYLKNPGGSSTELFQSNSKQTASVVLGSTNKIEETGNSSQSYLVGVDGSKYLITNNKTNVTIVGADESFPIDFEAELSKLETLSTDLAKMTPVSSDSVKTVYVPMNSSGTIDYSGVTVDGEYPFAHDQNAWNNTGLTADGKLLVINVDCTNAGNSVTVKGCKINGKDAGAWDSIANSVIWNFYTKDGDTYSPYSGKITYGEGLGTVLAPKAEVVCQASTNGSVIATTVSHANCEIHHIKLTTTTTTLEQTVACSNSAGEETAKGSLTVKKTLAGVTDAAKDKKFTFTIEKEGLTGTYGEDNEVEFTDGKTTITLEGGGSETIEDLPVGTYTVTEVENNADVDGYTRETTYNVTANGETTQNSNTAEVSDDEETTVTVTNTYTELTKLTEITVNKKWFGGTTDVTNSTTESIDFELYQKADDGEGVKYSDDTYKISEDNGWTYTIENLPLTGTAADGSTIKYTYYVEEITVDGYDTTYENNDGISSGTITIKNTKVKTYTLPKTGGIGTYPYIGGGVLLMAGTLLYGYEEARKRRKAGRRA